MKNTRIIEIFSAGCPVCNESIESIKKLACLSCEVHILDMHDKKVAEKARKFGVRSVPAVAIDGKLAECCSSRGIDLEILMREGLGQPIG